MDCGQCPIVSPCLAYARLGIAAERARAEARREVPIVEGHEALHSARREHDGLAAGKGGAADTRASTEGHHGDAGCAAQAERAGDIVGGGGLYHGEGLRRRTALEIVELRQHPGIVTVSRQRVGIGLDARAELRTETLEKRAHARSSRNADVRANAAFVVSISCCLRSGLQPSRDAIRWATGPMSARPSCGS